MTAHPPSRSSSASPSPSTPVTRAPPPATAEPARPAAAAHGAPARRRASTARKGGHDESLGAVMMHHVADGYVIEHPGVCDGGFSWDCELDLKEIFGDALVFHLGATKLDMTPTKHVVMMWIASVLLLVVVFSALRKKSLVPRGLYNFVEMLVQFVRNEIAVKNIGEKDADRFAPYLVSAFFFILFLNLFGLVPFAGTATANISVTVMMALFTFVVTQYAAIRAMGIGGYLAHLTGGVPKSLAPLWLIMIPVEFLGLFTKPFALTVRLFANMVAGHFVILALLGLIFALNSQWIAIRVGADGAVDLPARALRRVRAGLHLHHALVALHRGRPGSPRPRRAPRGARTRTRRARHGLGARFSRGGGVPRPWVVERSTRHGKHAAR